MYQLPVRALFLIRVLIFLLGNSGSFTNFDDVKKALEGVYGVWNNTDGFTVPIAQELLAGIRIFEIAKTLGTVKHYVWSNLDYTLKVSHWSSP